ncbi:MAG: cell division protein CrgA [Frankiaceae bacterium]|nr:cell division protein CrgA [Frankiaceae bacterium]
MPKSKVRKRDDRSPLSHPNRTPMSVDKMLAPSPIWYPIAMCVVLVLGLAYIVVYYLAGERVPVMQNLGSWNFAISFGLMIVGLGMAVRWR